jgi:sulfur carrier protein ThiS
MVVTLFPVGYLRTFVDEQECVLCAAGPTIAELAAEIGIPPELVAVAAIDDEAVSLSRRPLDGQEVTLMTIAGGG